MLKRCSKCGEDKELSEFHNNKATHDALSYQCKPCSKITKKEMADRRSLIPKKHSEIELEFKNIYHSLPANKNEIRQLENWKRNKKCLVNFKIDYVTDNPFKPKRSCKDI